MGKEAKTNAMRILEREKVPYTAHEYAHEEGVAVAEIDLSRLRAFRRKFPALDDADRFTVDL